jgi:hypothetical protein
MLIQLDGVDLPPRLYPFKLWTAFSGLKYYYYRVSLAVFRLSHEVATQHHRVEPVAYMCAFWKCRSLDPLMCSPYVIKTDLLTVNTD